MDGGRGSPRAHNTYTYAYLVVVRVDKALVGVKDALAEGLVRGVAVRIAVLRHKRLEASLGLDTHTQKKMHAHEGRTERRRSHHTGYD